jgi:hypothetical protein
VNDTHHDDPEAAGLRARMEQGELPRECLTLACFLGHLPSRHALGRGDSTAESEELAATPTLEFWGRRLARWGPPIMLRAGVALARATAARTQPDEATSAALENGLRVAETFLERAAGDMSDDALSERIDVEAKAVARAALVLDPDDPIRRACQTLLPVLRAMLDVLGGGAPNRALLDSHYVRALEQATATGLAADELKIAVRDELIPWVLG